MRISTLLLLVIAFAACAVPASAQRTGSRIGKDATAKDAHAAMQLLSICAVDRRPDLIRKWLDFLPGSAEETKLLSRWSVDLSACMYSDELVLDNKSLRFSPKAMRLPVAVEVARKLLRESPSTIAPTMTDRPWFAEKLASAKPDARYDKEFLAFQEFGHCVAASNWTSTRDLILSLPASPDEHKAIAKLAPSLGPCLTTGAKIVLTPANLRSIMAEPVYHVLVGPVVVKKAS